MTPDAVSQAKPKQLEIVREYPAPIEELWELWTTREGIESWWGPEGFTVKVAELDLRIGGHMYYTMAATAPEQVEFMKKAGLPLSTEVRLTYTEVSWCRYRSRTLIAPRPSTKPRASATYSTHRSARR
jgi:uncharacterized protein YndB with AHSA1/START domain